MSEAKPTPWSERELHAAQLIGDLGVENVQLKEQRDDLLEAAKEAKRYIEWLGVMGYRRDENVARLSAAIAKAKGGGGVRRE